MFNPLKKYSLIPFPLSIESSSQFKHKTGFLCGKKLSGSSTEVKSSFEMLKKKSFWLYFCLKHLVGNFYIGSYLPTSHRYLSQWSRHCLNCEFGWTSDQWWRDPYISNILNSHDILWLSSCWFILDGWVNCLGFLYLLHLKVLSVARVWILLESPHFFWYSFWFSASSCSTRIYWCCREEKLVIFRWWQQSGLDNHRGWGLLSPLIRGIFDRDELISDDIFPILWCMICLLWT